MPTPRRERAGAGAPAFLHVDIRRLDELQHLVGELVVVRAALAEAVHRARLRHGFRGAVAELAGTVERCGRTAQEIQERVARARTVPVGGLFDRFRNLVQDQARRVGKEIGLEIRGGQTEIDKRIVEELAEPLVHLVRNAVDHGIETAVDRQAAGKPRRGTVELTACQQGDHLVVEILDDGRGIDPVRVGELAVRRGVLTAEQLRLLDERAVVELVFQPGFSTAERVTGMSGRGIGLDAARSRIEALGGTLTLDSRPGRGCRAGLRLPLTLAIIDALPLELGDELYAVPLDRVEEILRVPASAVTPSPEGEAVPRRGAAVPLLRLDRMLGVAGAAAADPLAVVVVHDGVRSQGLAVGRVHPRRPVVVRPLGRRFVSAPGIAGAALAADGSVFLVLDVPALCRAARQAAVEGGPA